MCVPIKSDPYNHTYMYISIGSLHTPSTNRGAKVNDPIIETSMRLYSTTVRDKKDIDAPAVM